MFLPGLRQQPRLTSGKAVNWDGRSGPGARADGGSAAGAGGAESQQQVLERGALLLESIMKLLLLWFCGSCLL